MSALIDITNQKFGEWTVIKHVEKSNWLCRCSCGKEKVVSGYSLKSGKSTSCGHNTSGFNNLEGQRFGEWTVLEYLGNQKYRCRCSCGTEKSVSTYSLTSGKSKSCGHKTNRFKDDTGKHYGEWELIKYLGNQRYLCKCSCGKEKDIDIRLLRSGESKSCGHNTTGFKDIINQRYGRLTVTKYIGNHLWKCKCDCGNIINVHGYSLRSGNTKSCGCSIVENSRATKLKKYSEVAPTRFDNPRELWQIEILKNRENLESFLINYSVINGKNPHIAEIMEILNINKSTLLQKAKQLGVEDLFIMYDNQSNQENKLYEFIDSIYRGKIIRHDREVIKPKELDIFLPELGLAFEYNGEYWHKLCEERSPGYHRNKTLECSNKGIDLIHIWESDWINNESLEKSKIQSIIERYSSGIKNI